MISLNDIFNAEVGNEFMFADQPYIPNADILTLSAPEMSAQMDDMCGEREPMASNNRCGDNSLQLSHEMKSDCTEDEIDTMTASTDQSDGAQCFDDMRKHNHSEIEKKRRDKMNLLIKEMARLVPMCSAIPSARKLDKLTVLRMSVQHIKTIKNTAALSDSLSHQTPQNLTHAMIDRLLLEVTEGFLFVVSCDRGKILYVSDSVEQTLNYNTRDLLGMSWFDVLHHKDIPKVKEQLSLWDVMPKEKLVDAKTLLPLDEMMATPGDEQNAGIQSCAGSRRSFFCRMKYKFHLTKSDGNGINVLSKKKRRRTHIMNDKYCDLYCTGYMKTWTPVGVSSEDKDSDASVSNNCTGCLVAMARTLPHISSLNKQTVPDKCFPNKAVVFISRHSMDGMYLFVDQRMTPLLGYLPQELLGTSCYDYCHPDDVETLADSHRRALLQTENKDSISYRFKTKLGTYIYMKTSWKPFKNPWTRDFEYLIANNENIRDVDSMRRTNSQLMTSLEAMTKSISNAKPILVNNNCIQIDVNTKSADKKRMKMHDKQYQCSQSSSFNCPTPSSSFSSISSNKSPLSYDSTGSSQLSSGSIMKRFINNRIKHSKIGQQIAEEILEAQRRVDDFSSSSSQSSNSPPCSVDTGNSSSISGSLSGSISSASMGKSSNSRYSTKSIDQKSVQSMTTTIDSGIEANNYDNLPMPTMQGLSDVATHLMDREMAYSMNELTVPLGNHSLNYSQNMNTNTINNNVFNGTTVGAGCEETDEEAMSLIMSILEADAGLGGPIDFNGMPWPLY